jgi:hypothetical protein
MGAKAWSASFVLMAAGHAHAQPSATPASPPPPPPSAPLPAPPPVEREPPRHAICFGGRPYECASVLLLELGARSDTKQTVLSADLGLLIHDGLDAYGATIGVLGVTETDAEQSASLWYAGRYRRYLGTWGMAADVSIGYADGVALEVAIGWYDVVAITAGLNGYDRADGSHDLVPGVGLRFGSVLVGGSLYVSALVATGAR